MAYNISKVIINIHAQWHDNINYHQELIDSSTCIVIVTPCPQGLHVWDLPHPRAQAINPMQPTIIIVQVQGVK